MKAELVIFAYAPVGLGHLRVTDALYNGLKEKQRSLFLTTHDKSLTVLHTLTSQSRLGKEFGEWMQTGLPEEIFTIIFKKVLKTRTDSLKSQLISILEQSFEVPRVVVIVATHFALAHQLSAIKKQVEEEKQVKIFLVVQVTDVSPQHIWYVDGADLIVVPSIETKQALKKYAKRMALLKTPIKVLPYPLSHKLSGILPQQDYQDRGMQLLPHSKKLIHISIPVSGAAAGVNYHIQLSRKLYKKNANFRFHFVSRMNNYTMPFLKKLLGKPYAQVYMSPSDRQVVGFYEQLFEKESISLEVTKPSEQAFKALLSPRQRGGAILLFSQSYGRQEKDNLAFLWRRGLIPNRNDQLKLMSIFLKKEIFDSTCFENSISWRGLILPKKVNESVEFILWCLESGLLHYLSINKTQEIKNSVDQFWQLIEKRMEVKK